MPYKRQVFDGSPRTHLHSILAHPSKRLHLLAAGISKLAALTIRVRDILRRRRIIIMTNGLFSHSRSLCHSHLCK